MELIETGWVVRGPLGQAVKGEEVGGGVGDNNSSNGRSLVVKK
jgi:hypothetical protein